MRWVLRLFRENERRRRSWPSLPGCARDADQVVGHQYAYQPHEYDGDRGAARFAAVRVDEQLDLVSDHARPGRLRQQVVGVVVAEHRKHDDHHAGENSLLGERKSYVQECPEGTSPEIASGLNLALIDAIEGSKQREDQERNVAVDETHHNGLRPTPQPVARLGKDSEEGQNVVDVTTSLEEVHPGKHPHQVGDPEGCEYKDEIEDLSLTRVASHEVGDRVA